MDDNKIWYPEKCLILLRDNVSEITGIDSEIESRYGSLTTQHTTISILDKNKEEIEKEIEEQKRKEEERQKQIAQLRTDLTNNIRNIHAMNAAHILFECATSRDWGLGLGWDGIDIDSYKTAADKLFAEKFGLCFRYNRQDQLQTFIQQILDHIGTAQYADL